MTWPPYLAPAGPEADPPVPVTIGVLVTACNVAHLLPETLASVDAQTRAPDEVVVVDDASDDDVAAAVAPWADRVLLVPRAVRGGEGAAKNTGARALSTDVVVILDGDDAMHPRRLEALARVCSLRPDLGIVTTEWEEFGPAAQESAWRLADHFPTHAQREAVLTWNFMPAPALRRDELLAAGGFDEHLRYGPDWECYVRMMLRGSQAGLVTEPLYRYRRWSGQQTADVERVLRGRVQVAEGIAGLPGLTGRDREVLARGLLDRRFELWTHELAGGGSTRRSALRLLRAAGAGRRRRVLAGAGVVSPALAGALVNRRTRSGSR